MDDDAFCDFSNVSIIQSRLDMPADHPKIGSAQMCFEPQSLHGLEGLQLI